MSFNRVDRINVWFAMTQFVGVDIYAIIISALLIYQRRLHPH